MSDFSADPANLIPANARLRRSRRLWRVLFIGALVIAVLAVAGRFAFSDSPIGDHIARVAIDGVITTDPDRLKMLEKLADDAQVKGVIIAINSGGGTTAGGEELYEAITALRAKKPVVTTIGELGASAAYMTAIAADRIFARNLSIVGSIGVLFQHVDAGKLLSTIGIDLDKVQTGPLKAEPDLNDPLTGEVRASLQALVDNSFGWFVDRVSERRGLTHDETLALADGRILTGRQGVDVKLIDATGGEPEAIGWLETDKGVPKDLPVVDSWPPPSAGWFGLGKLLGQAARGAVGLSPDSPIALDGLVSLWQAAPSM
jgi:protease-4